MDSDRQAQTCSASGWFKWPNLLAPGQKLPSWLELPVEETLGGGPGKNKWTRCWDQPDIRVLPLNSKRPGHQTVSGSMHLSPQHWTPNLRASPPGGAAQEKAPGLSHSLQTPVPGTDSSLGYMGEGATVSETPQPCVQKEGSGCQPLRMSLPDEEGPPWRQVPSQNREKAGGEVQAWW